MNRERLPLIIDPDELQAQLGREDILLVDLCHHYDQGHIPGAVHLDYARLIDPRPPLTGPLPPPERLGALFASLGLGPDIPVVAYDDEGGGRAARLLWTLAVVGHARYSLLDGGLAAWRDDGHPLVTEPAEAETSPFIPHLDTSVIAGKDYILQRLHDPAVAIVDCRTPQEYSGEFKQAQRGGHIPGAVNIEWLHAMDQQRQLRLKPADELHALYESMGVTPDKEIITYCHSHRRSAHTWLVLKSLGYGRVRAYPGAWSEWGNDPDTPVEQ